MIADLKPYAEYKESGLPWLGQVPTHWGVLSVKQIFDIQLGKMLQNTPQTADDIYVPYLKAQHVQWTGVRTSDLPRMWASPRDIMKFGVQPNDLLVCEGGEGGRCAVIMASDQVMIIQNALHRVRSRTNDDVRFLSYVLSVVSSLGWLDAINNKATIAHFTRDKFGALGILLPPPSEQAAIVRFLDWATSRLDKAIRAKRKIIALLNEQKQAIIHRAVTRGLDPNVSLKPSGIPWLGDIPEHWEVSRIKNEFRCLNTQRVPLNAVERGAMTARTYDYYGASGVIDKVGDYLFDDELLLIAEDGANLVLRNLPLAIIARGKFWVNNHAHILKPNRGSIVYLAHLLETLNYKPWISGAAQPKLTQDRLMSISIAVAPPEEQIKIVEQTSEQTRPLTTTISRLEREIDLLREYRTRLIADVVTGKLDVRETASTLPNKDPLRAFASSRESNEPNEPREPSEHDELDDVEA